MLECGILIARSFIAWIRSERKRKMLSRSPEEERAIVVFLFPLARLRAALRSPVKRESSAVRRELSTSQRRR